MLHCDCLIVHPDRVACDQTHTSRIKHQNNLKNIIINRALSPHRCYIESFQTLVAAYRRQCWRADRLASLDLTSGGENHHRDLRLHSSRALRSRWVVAHLSRPYLTPRQGRGITNRFSQLRCDFACDNRLADFASCASIRALPHCGGNVGP
ncbi:hypothetical protein CC80DRAFT_203802 [Byssothecium circinans]|uniref:Uncharacterized protein n=1 Tax=Byssothecium circinans TaxID=147558 RepID=A0A6A5TFH5_9PLEO|nr:hypothetical protein CC80DRAFT_203802 [Byssothecium circinans]